MKARRYVTGTKARPTILALEPRLMFDGAAAADAAQAAAPADGGAKAAPAPAPVVVREADPSKDGGRKEVAFVDTSVADYKTLEAEIREGVEIVEIDGGASGLAQIAQWARDHGGYDAIHLLSHGGEGTLRLGTDTITSASLSDETVKAELAALGNALTADGDLLLYGCSVAFDQAGQAFVADLAGLTGADVAASTDATGVTDGADWAFELNSGPIETAIVLTEVGQQVFEGTLGAPSVGTTTFNTATTAGLGSGNGTTSVAAANVLSSGWDFSAVFTANTSTSNLLRSHANGGAGTSGVIQAGAATSDFVSSFTLASNDGSEFDFKSLDLNSTEGASDLTFTGYRNGVAVTGATFTYSLSQGSYTNRTYTTVSLDGNDNFNNVDKIVITLATPRERVMIDNIVIGPAITAPTGPSTTVSTASLSDDTGTANDWVTKTASQTINGTLSAALGASERVEVSYDNGANWSDATYTVGSTDWSASHILSGTNTFKARVSDSSGSSTAYSHTYTLDTTAPTAPTIAISADTGSNTSDGVTKTATQTVTVTAEGGATLDIDYGDGSTHGTASGSHTYAADGKYTVSVTATDSAGNVSSAGTKVIVVDNAAPTDITPSVTSLGVTAATNGATFCSLTATDATAITGFTDSWTYAVTGGTDAGKFSITGGNLVINNTGGLSNGSYSVEVTATDTAGNTYAKTLTLAVVTGPSTTVSGASLSADTGTANDWVTKTASQIIDGTLSAALGASERVEVSYDNGLNWSDATYTVGSTAWSASHILSGTNTFQARVSDSNGSSTAYSHSYTLDTTAPTAPTIAISADTGSNTSDGVTKTATQTVTVTAEGGATLDIDYGDGSTHGTASGSHTYAADGKYTVSVTATDSAGNVSSAGTKVIVVDSAAPTDITPSVTSLGVTAATNGATFCSLTATDATAITGFTDSWTYAVTGGTDAGKFSITGGNLVINNTGGLSGGTYSVEVTATDTAGNTYAKTLTLAVVTGPSTTVSTASLSDDTGTANDWVTKTASQTINGTLSAALGANERVEVSYDNGLNWSDATSTVGSTDWSASHTLSGTNTFKARVSDSNGSSTAYSHSYTLDTTAPTAPTIAISADTGSNTSDGVTKTATQTVTVTAEGGSTLDIDYGDGSTHGTASGSHTYAADGKYTVSVTATDSAGNVSSAGTKVIVVDSAAPTDITPSVTSLGVTAATNGATFCSLTATDATAITGFTDSWTYAITGGTDAGKFSITGGNLVINNTGGLSGGTYSVEVTATDTAGNTYAKTLSLTVATGPSTTVSTASLSDDTGTANDWVTKTASQTIDGTLSAALGANERVEVSYDNGLNWSDASYTVGSTEWSASHVLSGTNTFQARVSDSNGSSTAYSHSYTLDTTAPTVTSIVRQTPSTGATNADTLVYRVTFSEAVSNVGTDDFQVATGGSTATVTGVTSAGGNSYDVTVSGGDLADYNGTVTLEFASAQDIADTAGNALTATAPTGTNTVSYTLDNTVPTVTSIVRQTSSGEFTNADSVVYRVTFSEAVASLTAADFAVTGGSTATVTGVVSAGGNSYDITVSGGDLATYNGTVTLAFAAGQEIADSAGNVLTATTPSGTNEASYTVDNLAPTAPTLTTSGSTTTGVEVSGTAEANATVKIYKGGDLIATVTAEPTGAWSYTAILAEGTHTLTATATDAAGNVSPTSTSADVVVTKPPTRLDPVNNTDSKKAPDGTEPAKPIVSTEPAPVVTLVTTIRDTTPQTQFSTVPTITVPSGPSPSGSAPSGPVQVIAGAFTAPAAQGFQVAVAARPPGGGDALLVNAPIRDTAVVPGARISVTVPAEAFASTRADAVVTLTATRSNGASLPGWMAFNPQTGTFDGTPPPGFKGEVVVKVIARDNQGREAVQTFRIVVGQGEGNLAPGQDGGRGEGQDGGAPPGDGRGPQGAPGRSGDLGQGGKRVAEAAGRPSLTSQLRELSQEGRVAKQAALFDALKRGGRAA